MSITDVKTQDQIISELRAQVGVLNKSNKDLNDAIKELENRNERIIRRGIDVVEEKQALAMSPEIANQKAEMEFQLELAARFIKAEAFPKLKNAEQAYVIIKAGEEMNLSPIESLNGLYLVNGVLSSWGKQTIAFLTRGGYTMTYENEDQKGVDVFASKGDEKLHYRVDANCKELVKSNAYKGNPKNKMRYHGAFQILKFNLPHLIRGLADSSDQVWKEIKEEDNAIDMQVNAIKLKVKSTKNPEDLNALYQTNIELISGNMELTKLFADIKEKFEQK